MMSPTVNGLRSQPSVEFLSQVEDLFATWRACTACMFFGNYGDPILIL